MSYFPSDWTDDERMRVMMGEMPLINKDRIAYNGRINFWKGNLYQWLKLTGKLSFNMQDVEAAFQRGNLAIKCLPQVLYHLLQNGILALSKDVERIQPTQESWVEWSKRMFVSTPTKWVWTYVRGTDIQNEKFVYLEILQKKSEEFLDIFWSLPHSENDLDFDVDRLLTIDSLYRLMKPHFQISLDDLILLIHHLRSLGKASLTEHRGCLLVKFTKPGEIQENRISETELAEFDLMDSIEKMSKRLAGYEAEIESSRLDAKKHVAAGQKAKALAVLRRKKRCEKSAENLSRTLENASTCLDQLRESQLNMGVLDSFQAGAEALKCSLSKSGGGESVQNSMDLLQETLSECQEMGESIAFAVSADADLDEELAGELERLLLGPDSEKEALPVLPDVPSNSLEVKNDQKCLKKQVKMPVLNS